MSPPPGHARGPEALVIPMGRVLRIGAIAAAVALPVSALLGWMIGGVPGFWGALIGMAIAVSFFGVTVAVALLTAEKEASVLGAWVLGSWLIKTVILIAVMAVLRGEDFYSRAALFAALMIGTIATLLLEAVVVTRTRVPYVEPRP